MTLNKIQSNALPRSTQVDQYQQARENKRSNHASPTDLRSHQAPMPAGEDQAEISSNAKKLVDLRQALHTGISALEEEPDTRANKMAQVKDRLASGFYQSADVQDKVAMRLSTLFMEQDLL